jgi:hypothetical protein
MPTFGQEFFKGFTAADSLRDYTHASKTFTTNAYELKPRFKFLFHVSFTLNTAEIPALSELAGVNEITSLSYLVKTVDLPKYTIAAETLNQYNRKRVVQTKINYDPVTVTFHDDGGDNSRNLWYNYYSYYYKDPSQDYLAANSQNGSMGASANMQKGFGYNSRDIYNDTRVGDVNDWGYVGESYNDGTSAASGKPPFFRDIRIYGMDQHKTAEYVLINPIITNWSHDQYNYSEGAGVMQNSMTIAYETVKYYSGAVGNIRPDANVQGFADPAHYDQTLSPISRPGSRATVFGQGGLLDAGGGILKDLESKSVLGLIGAAQKAGTAYNTFKGKNIASSAISEATALGKNAIRGSTAGDVRAVQNRATGMFFPTPQTPPTNTR